MLVTNNYFRLLMEATRCSTACSFIGTPTPRRGTYRRSRSPGYNCPGTAVGGYVIVEFTVTRSGTTRDVVVIESTDSLLDRAALEAASKFKYKPRWLTASLSRYPDYAIKSRF